MSRIDEALKRLSSGAVEPAPKAPPRHIEAVENRTGLELYLPESTPNQSSPAPTTEVRVQRSPDVRPLPTTAERVVTTDSLDAGRRTFKTRDLTRPAATAQYRRLALALQELQKECRLQTLMVTSAVEGDGKSVTVANLALTLGAEFKQRVVIVDANLRAPSIHTMFGLPGTAGLSQVLRSEHDAIGTLPVSEHVSVLPAGGADFLTAAALTSDRMEQVIHELRRRFDWVLLDTAPVTFTPDAQLLARIAGAVLFVIRARSTPCRSVEEALAVIGRESVVGTVLYGGDQNFVASPGVAK